VIVGIRGQEIKGQADFYNKLWESGVAGVEIVIDVLKGNRILNQNVKTVDREQYLRHKPVY
jgi:S1-C subfamily serine protease